MPKHAGGIALGILLLITASAASAVPVVYRYEARITEISNGPAVDFRGLVNVGDILTGVVGWDTVTPLRQITSSNVHTYAAPDPRHQWTVDNFGLGARAGGTSGLVYWGVTTAYSGSVSSGQQLFGATHSSFFEGGAGAQPFDVPFDSFVSMFQLWDSDANVFSEPFLPAALALSEFERREMKLFATGLVPVADWSIETEIVSLTPIPEPGSGLLVMLGLAGLGWHQRRRQVRLNRPGIAGGPGVPWWGAMGSTEGDAGFRCHHRDGRTKWHDGVVRRSFGDV